MFYKYRHGRGVVTEARLLNQVVNDVNLIDTAKFLTLLIYETNKERLAFKILILNFLLKSYFQ